MFTSSQHLAGMIDQTILRPDATRRETIDFVEQALPFGFASVCILPAWVADASDILADSKTKVCTVVGFPHGLAAPGAKEVEAALVVADGAHEVDMVINVSALKSGAELIVFEEIERVVAAANLGGAIVKVIIECAYLTDAEKQRASKLAEEAGAAFVKTSTGFAPTGATVLDVALMRQAVSDAVSIKAAGGIRTLAFATELVSAGASRLGTSVGVSLIAEYGGADANTTNSY
ncbi:MAG: deoxyribose-phosphate aldolase [Armatimonadota bacterium]